MACSSMYYLLSLISQVVRVEKIINAYKVSFGKPQGMCVLRIHSNIWEDNIQMDLRKIRDVCPIK
jgi:hypothetical protein